MSTYFNDKYQNMISKNWNLKTWKATEKKIGHRGLNENEHS